jgi:hypothetical protein
MPFRDFLIAIFCYIGYLASNRCVYDDLRCFDYIQMIVADLQPYHARFAPK